MGGRDILGVNPTGDTVLADERAARLLETDNEKPNQVPSLRDKGRAKGGQGGAQPNFRIAAETALPLMFGPVRLRRPDRNFP